MKRKISLLAAALLALSLGVSCDDDLIIVKATIEYTCTDGRVIRETSWKKGKLKDKGNTRKYRKHFKINLRLSLPDCEIDSARLIEIRQEGD